MRVGYKPFSSKDSGVSLKNKKLIIFSLVWGALLSACTQTEDSVITVQNPVVCEDGELKSVGIIGGKTLSSQSTVAQGIVFLLSESEKTDSEGRALSSLCTGSLIDQNIVLTAAHCVPSDLNPRKIRVAFSVDPLCQLQQQGYQKSFLEVDEIIQHEKWDSKNSAYDLAMIRLSDAAPAERRPLKLLNRPVELTTESPIFVSGYGRTTDYNVQDKDKPMLKVARIRPSLNSDEPSKITKSNLNPVLYLDQSQGQGACSGDSGGPTFLKDKGQLYVLGVNSAVDTLQKKSFERKSDVTCKIGLASVSVYSQISWISQIYQRLLNEDSLGKQFQE